MYGWAFTYENSTARVLFDLSVRFAVHQLWIYNLAVFLYDDMQMIAQLLVVNIASGLCNGILLIDLIALFHSDIGQALIGYAQILAGDCNTFAEDIIFLHITHLAAEACQNIESLFVEGIVHALIGSVDAFKLRHTVNLVVLSIKIIKNDLCLDRKRLDAFFFLS